MTLPFPTHTQQTCTKTQAKRTDRQTQKKDIAAYLSNHVQPNHNTTLTLSDQTGKSVTIKCNTDNPAHLLDIAMDYLRH